MILSKTSYLTGAVLTGLALFVTACGSSQQQYDSEPTTMSSSSTNSSMSSMSNAHISTPPNTQDGTALGMEAADQERRKATVRALVEKANAAANAGRHEEARDFYRQATNYDPTNLDASDGYLRMTRLVNGGTSVSGGAMQEMTAKEQARTQKAIFLHRQGLEALGRGEYDDAVSSLDQSYQLLKFGPRANTTLTADAVKNALDAARDQRDRFERGESERLQTAAAKAERIAADKERLRLDRKIRDLYENLFDRIEAEQYARAEHIADAIIRLAPRDEDAKKLRAQARKARLALQNRENVANTMEETQILLQEAKIRMIPQAQDIIFPDDWARIKARQPRTISDSSEQISESDRTVANKLAAAVLPRVDWNGKTLDEVVDEIRTQADVNVYVTPSAKTTAEDAGELSLEFTQVSADYALKAALEQLGVVYKVENGLVRVQTTEESGKYKVVEFYDVKDLTNPIQSFPGVALNLNPSGVDLSEEEEDDAEPNSAIEMERLIELIKRAVDPNWDEDGGNRLDPKNGTLIVRQTPEKQRLVRRLLDDLRRNTGIQVAIEARFVQIENNFLQDIGVDLRGLGDDSGGVGVPGVGTNNPFDDFGIPGGSGVGTPAIPGGIGTGTDSGVFFSDRNGDTNVRARTENLFDEVLGDPNTLDNSGGLSFQFAYLDDVQLEAILRAVQKYERINSVTAPRLLVYNTQRANLTVLNEVSYIKDFDVEIAQASVIADPIVDKIREGVVLDVRPIVSHDRRFITLELRPTVATLVRPIRRFTTNLAVGSAVTIQLPELRKQQVNTTVVMPDGGTLLLGGLKFASEQSLDSGVPFLKDIPILSFFFSRKGKSTTQRDVIILLKAKIIIMEELEPGARDGSLIH
ncbi:MAG: hypothetical protein V3W41_01385 [Planctomycetota bacterium]